MSERGQPIYLREDEIIISRAEYEAYRAAAKALVNIVPRFEKACLTLGNAEWATTEATKMHREALAALRAAGIDPSEGKANE